MVDNDRPVAPSNQYFETDLPPFEYDPDKAKHYLKKAGHTSFKVNISSSDAAFPGAVDTAILYKEHAKACGIDINVIREPRDGYWTDVWMKKPWSMCFWSGRPTEDWAFSLSYADNAHWNDTFWKNDRFNKLLREARTENEEVVNMNSRERVMTALQLKEPDRVPFMDFADTIVKQKIMGTENIDEAEFAKKIGMDAIYFTDYCTPLFCKSHSGVEDEPKAFGMTGETEFIGEGLIRTEEDLDKIVLPNPHDDSYYDPAKRFIEKYHDSDLAIYAGLRPFGMFNTIYSMPMMDFAIALGENLKLIDTMMDIFIEWNIVVIEKLQNFGLDFIATYNDMAYKEGPLVSPQVFREVFLPKMKVVADAIKLPWAFHSDGNLTIVMEDLLTLGMNCVNPFEPPCMDLKAAKEKWGDRICLWGNIDLVKTLPYGTVAEVEAEVKQRIEDAGAGGGYICASANSITGFCKIENVFAMTNAVKKYGGYPLEWIV